MGARTQIRIGVFKEQLEVVGTSCKTFVHTPFGVDVNKVKGNFLNPFFGFLLDFFPSPKRIENLGDVFDDVLGGYLSLA